MFSQKPFTKLAKLTAVALALLTQPASAERFILTANILDENVGLGPSGVLAARSDIADETVFELVDLHNGMFAIRDTATGLYLRTGISQYDYLRADTDAVNAASMFGVTRHQHFMLLRSVLTGDYVGYNLRSGRLRAVFSADDTNISFLVVTQQQPPARAEEQPVPPPSGRDAEPAPRLDLSFAGNWQLSHSFGVPVSELRENAFEQVPQATISFTPDGQFHGFGGCNDFDGELYVQGARIAVHTLNGPDHNRCGAAAERLDQRVENGLLRAQYFGLVQNGHVLSVIDADDTELMRFTRR